MSAFQPKVAAAIDFGTHGSGFAWSVKCDQNDDAVIRKIDTVDQWTDQPLAYPKNLTALLLDADGNVLEWGHSAYKKYSHLIEEDGKRLVNGLQLKMSLNSPDEHPPTGGGPHIGGDRTS